MKINKWIFLGLAVISVVVMGILIPLKAETDKDKKDALFPKVDEETLKLVKTIQVWKLVTDVSLSEKQLTSFLPVFQEQERLKWNFWHEKNKAIKKLRTLDKNKTNNEEVLKNALEDYIALEDEFNRRMEELDKELMNRLTLRQKIKYVLFQDSYHQDLRTTLIKIKELGKKQRQPVLLKQAKPKKDE